MSSSSTLTRISPEEHAKRQKAAADQTITAEDAANHPMVDTMLTAKEQLGKVPGEPDKKPEFTGVNAPIEDTGEKMPGVEEAIAAAEERTAKAEEKAQEAAEAAKEEPPTVKAPAVNHKKKK